MARCPLFGCHDPAEGRKTRWRASWRDWQRSGECQAHPAYWETEEEFSILGWNPAFSR
jgi:hypothetical protein